MFKFINENIKKLKNSLNSNFSKIFYFFFFLIFLGLIINLDFTNCNTGSILFYINNSPTSRTNNKYLNLDLFFLENLKNYFFLSARFKKKGVMYYKIFINQNIYIYIISIILLCIIFFIF
jgi:hypothetical protein